VFSVLPSLSLASWEEKDERLDLESEELDRDEKEDEALEGLRERPLLPRPRERLRERERLAALGAMAAGLAHEIRNPLGAIKGAAEYLDPNKFSDEEGEFLQVIVDETNRLNTVVSQFLDYARPFRPKFRDTDINDVVRKTAKLIAPMPINKRTRYSPKRGRHHCRFFC